MKEQLPILHKYLDKNSSNQYFLNTIDLGIDLDMLLENHTSEEIEEEIRTFINLPIERIKFQNDSQNIINEIIDYSLK